MCPPRHLQRRAVREARLRLRDDSHPGFADLIEVSFQRLDCAAVCLSSLLQLLERFLLPRQGRAQPILPTRDRAQHFLRGRDARRRRGLRGCAAFGGGPARTLSPASRPCLARLLLARAWSLRRGTSGGLCCAAAGLGRGFVSHVGAFSSFESSAVICPSTALFRRCTPGRPDQSTMRDLSCRLLRFGHRLLRFGCCPRTTLFRRRARTGALPSAVP